MKRDEGRVAFVKRAFDGEAVDWINAVKDDEFDSGFGGGFQAKTHGGDVSIESAANILDIEHQGIESFELLGSGRAAGPVQTEDRQTRFLIRAVAHLFVELAADAVLRAEERLEFHFGSFLENVDGRFAITVDARVIGDQ